MRYRHVSTHSDRQADDVGVGADSSDVPEDSLWADIFETAWLDTTEVQLRNTLIQGD